MVDEALEQYISDISEREDESGTALDEFMRTEEKEFEWLISPDQFADFWIASIYLLVGTWQIITIIFLLLE